MIKTIRSIIVCFLLASCSVVVFAQQDPTDVGEQNSGAPCQLSPFLTMGNVHNPNPAATDCASHLKANGYGTFSGTTPSTCTTSPNLNYGSGTNFNLVADADFNPRNIIVLPTSTPTAAPIANTSTQAFICSYSRVNNSLLGSGVVNGGNDLCFFQPNHGEFIGGDFRNGNGGTMGCGNNCSPGFGVGCSTVGGVQPSPTPNGKNFWGDAQGRNVGTTQLGAPLIIGNCAGDCGTVYPNLTAMDMTSTSNTFWVPSAAFSEGNASSMGDVILLCGQNTVNVTTDMKVGMQGCDTFRTVRNSGNNLVPNQYTVDTSCALGGASTIFNFTTTSITSNACGAAWGFYQNEHGSVAAIFDFTGESAGATITVGLPSVGGTSYSGCTFAAGGTPATDATAFAAAFNGGTFGTCSTTGMTTRWSAAVLPQCNTWTPCGAAANTVEISCINCNPQTLASAITATGCTTCTSAIKDFRPNNNGVSNMFSYGVRRVLYTWPDARPYFAKINDIQYQTSMGTPTAHANNLMGRMFVFFSHGPGRNCDGTFASEPTDWCWGDNTIMKINTVPSGGTLVTGPTHIGALATGSTPAAGEMGILGPTWSCGNLANTPCQNYDDSTQTLHTKIGLIQPCTGICTPPANWVGPQLDLSYAGQNTIQEGSTTAPMFGASNEDVALDSSGFNNAWLTYPCWDSGSANKSAFCYFETSGGTGQTIRAGFIDDTLTAGTNELIQGSIIRTPQGNLIAAEEIDDFNLESHCSASPCILLWKWTGSAWSFVSNNTPAWATTNVSVVQNCTFIPHSWDGSGIDYTCFAPPASGNVTWLPGYIDTSQL